MSAPDTSRISPTAHYTGYVWCRHGMSHAALETRQGRAYYRALQPFNRLSSAVNGGMNLETMLLQRHRIIDHILRAKIESGEVQQVIEIASGMSPRGWRFMSEYRDRGLVYVEGDLPDMIARKRRTLDSAGLLGEGHILREINALADHGPDSLFGAAADLLDSTRPTAIITEGLVNYFDPESVRGMWERFARCLKAFPSGTYLCDLGVAAELDSYLTARVFRRALSVFARGRVHVHFEDADMAERELREAGFADARAILPREMAGEVDIPISRGPAPLRVVHATV